MWSQKAVYILSNDFFGNICFSFTEILLLTLHRIFWIYFLKFSFSSRYIQRCFWHEALSTRIWYKKCIIKSSFFLEKITFCAGFAGSELNRIFDLKPHFEINEGLLMRSFPLSFLSLTTLKINESSTNNFALHFNPFGRSFTYIRKRRGSYRNPMGAPARIGLHNEVCPFKTHLWNLFEKINYN